jgi:hypothetical protein
MTITKSTVDRALEHAQMAYDLGLMEEPLLYEIHSLACNLCGYSYIGSTGVGTGVDSGNGPLNGSEVPVHWLRDHTPIELIMRSVTTKEEQNE